MLGGRNETGKFPMIRSGSRPSYAANKREARRNLERKKKI